MTAFTLNLDQPRFRCAFGNKSGHAAEPLLPPIPRSQLRLGVQLSRSPAHGETLPDRERISADIGRLDSRLPRLLTEGLSVERFSNQFPRFSPTSNDGLSRLVHQRAARKPISDARTATYVILSTGSGPGGRRFKSFRPDQSFRISNLQNAKAH